MALGAGLLAAPGVFAARLTETPRQTEGPFYPDHLPLDTDNDLLVINNALTSAVGEVSYVSGRILDARGEPLRNAVVEIWQCDAHGAYLHSGTGNKESRDKNFQGFGRFVTGSTGEYLFRTIKPVPYPGRTPHIHYAIKQGDKRMLTTQLYIKGFPQNATDGIYRGLGNKQPLVTTDFAPLKGSTLGELTAHFEIVIGNTPEDPSQDRMRGPGGPPPPGAPGGAGRPGGPGRRG